ncbi:Sodium/hydrogen exchanger 8 [Heterocephalus glaber]|uniref:Sodium/hydrogen exchanger 8 n=1 Tax=Heterocephalus glaber TaxID=10181 RepID=G5AZ08_HETGA|nr:Sodium/hydrogen exchanger 8 [Heterocephalus glaber]
MTIFFSLLVLAICIILVHLLIRYRLHFLPESVAVVSLGILMGAVIKIIEFKKLANWKEEEMFRPNMFFLLLLPPIIFESGYSLHKGNFFQNIGSITLFAVFGTAISAFVVGGGIYFLGQGNFFQNIGSITLFAVFGTAISAFVVGGGIYFLGQGFFCVSVFVCFILQADVISKLNMTDSFAFGSLISAVDPVATIAIFNALHVDPVLNMLVFGESILNDAVSIVLTNPEEAQTGSEVASLTGCSVRAAAHLPLSLMGPSMRVAAQRPGGLRNFVHVLGELFQGTDFALISEPQETNIVPGTNTAEGLTRKNMSDVSGWQTFLQALGYFLKMFFGSSALGTLTGLISALITIYVLKHIDLRKTPSLEFGMMIIFAYLPYGLAEGISLSGIMAILFSGIVMSHYTHHNLSPVTQILMQQTLRTVAFLCETCVFAFLGLSIFSFPHKLEISFVIWCIVLVLFGRAVNIFPLSYLLNFFRDHKITPKMMFIMWFSGLRGAIPYALSLHLDLEPMEKRQLIGTTTIVIVLFTILLLGGSTMPLIRLMDIEDAKARRRSKKDVNLSKTEKMLLQPPFLRKESPSAVVSSGSTEKQQEADAALGPISQGNTIESEHLSELTEEEYEAHYIRRQDLKGFMWLDAKYLNPFFTRRLTQEDLHHGRIQMKSLTNKWYEEVRQGPSGSEDDEQELF